MCECARWYEYVCVCLCVWMNVIVVMSCVILMAAWQQSLRDLFSIVFQLFILLFNTRDRTFILLFLERMTLYYVDFHLLATHRFLFTIFFYCWNEKKIALTEVLQLAMVLVSIHISITSMRADFLVFSKHFAFCLRMYRCFVICLSFNFFFMWMCPFHL